MNTIYAREDYLGADEYIDVVNKSGLNRPVGDRGRVERMLAHANLILTARQDGRLVGFARSLTDFCFCCYLSDLAVDKACQGQGIGRRLISIVDCRFSTPRGFSADTDRSSIFRTCSKMYGCGSSRWFVAGLRVTSSNSGVKNCGSLCVG